MDVYKDQWLSAAMVRDVFRVAEAGAATADPACDRMAMDHLGERILSQDGAMYYARIGAEQIGVVRRLCGAGFYVVEANVALKLDPHREGDVPAGRLLRGRFDGPVVEADDAGSECYEQVLSVAESSFRYSRFHLDPMVSEAIANRIKREWVYNYLKKRRGDRLFVALSEGEAVGFLAAMASESDGKKKATVDLMGVSPDFRRRGVGGALVMHFISHYRKRADSLHVGTQTVNMPSLKLYHACGFLHESSSYVLHAHASPRTGGTIDR